MTIVAALQEIEAMKRKAHLVLSKETLRALTQGQLPGINGGAKKGTVTTTLDPFCFYTEPSFNQCP